MSSYIEGEMLKRFALFMDGMARAMFLPFGPELVYRMMYEKAEITPSTWSSVAFRVALTMATFLVGHTGGPVAAEQLKFVFDPTDNLRGSAARLGGLAVALHLFSWGAGLSSTFFLLLVRFLYALVVGILRALTASSTIPSSDEIDPVNSLLSDEATKQQPTVDSSDFAPGTAKIYLTGFSVSALSGGIFFQSISASELFQKLTGTYLWSTLFFIGVAVVGELGLRGAFALTTQPEHLDRSSGVARKFRRVVRRIVGGKPRVSFKFLDEEGATETERLMTSPDGSTRQRLGSVASHATDISEYFDCNSDLDLSEEGAGSLAGGKAADLLDDDMNEAARYIDRICCYADGSPAYVPPGDCKTKIPANYMEEYGGNRSKAMKMWQEAQKWRREQNVWKIHRLPNKFYYDIKKAYPHNPHGYSKEGLAVVYEQPGRMNLRALFQGECTIDDMVMHNIFFQEYLSNYLCASQELRSVAGLENVPYSSAGYGILVVMDIQGAGVSMMSTDVIKYLTRASAIIQAYYPRSMKRLVVCNCPWFASGIFQTIKKILPDSVKADLFSSNCVEGLRQYIDDDQIPPEYGGSSPYKLGEHPYAIGLNELVDLAAQGDLEANNDTPKIVSSTPKEMTDNQQMMDTPEKSTRLDEIPQALSDPTDNTESSIRRRAISPLPFSDESIDIDKPDSLLVEKDVIGVDSLAFASFFCAFWSGVQGAVEIAIPLFMASPVHFGGLGYSASTNGVTFFCVSFVIFAMLSTRKVDGLLSQSRSDPLKALRRGLGIESIVLLLLAFIPLKLSVEDRSYTVGFAVVASIAMGALASTLGRSGASHLSRLVSESVSHHLSKSKDLSAVATSAFSAEYMIAECTSGRVANFLSLIAEVFGMVTNSQIWALSLNRERPSKYDGTIFLFVPALIAGCLYFLSHFLRLKPSQKLREIEDNGSQRKAV